METGAEGERQTWCIVSGTAGAHSWVLGAGKQWCSPSLGEKAGAPGKELTRRGE